MEFEEPAVDQVSYGEPPLQDKGDESDFSIKDSTASEAEDPSKSSLNESFDPYADPELYGLRRSGRAGKVIKVAFLIVG